MSDTSIPSETNEMRPQWITYLAAGVAVLHLYFNSFSTISELWTSMLHFGMLGLLVALIIPASKRWTSRLNTITGIPIGLLVLSTSMYLIWGEDAFYARGQSFNTFDWIAAVLVITLALELTRRTTGWVIPILAILSMTYAAWWGTFLPGVLHFPGLTWETVLYRATYSGDGMFGTIARISWTYVFMFILFGTALLRSGASDVILSLAQAAAGRFIGGTGLVAVLSSSLMGSVSGSAIGNTVSTGVVTIPLMKRSGFPARSAAGIEAAASTGGQLMPPIMGAGAFLMATYTGQSYLTIIGVATIPALLYFLSVAFQVRLTALKHGLSPMEVKKSRGNLNRGWPVLMPITLLVVLLVSGFTPTWAAGAATIACLICARFGPNPMTPRTVVETLAQASITSASISVLLIAVGLVVMAVTTTGLGPTISQMIVAWSDGNLLLTLLLVALASLVLGLGLPVTAAYVVLAPLAAPALSELILDSQLLAALTTGTLNEGAKTILTIIMPEQTKGLPSPMTREAATALITLIPIEVKRTVLDQGLSAEILTTSLLTAHMIVFWLSQDSNITPPVCLTAFAAAGLAGTRPMETGFTAWAYAKGLYVIPLVMAVSPLIGGTGLALMQVILFTIFALYAFAAAIQGFMEGPLSLEQRFLSGGAAGALIWPHGSWTIGGLSILIVIGMIWISKRHRHHG